jgi:hypothetical protein
MPQGGAGKNLAVGSYPDGVFELFLIGTDDQVYHSWQNGLRLHAKTTESHEVIRPGISAREIPARTSAL